MTKTPEFKVGDEVFAILPNHPVKRPYKCVIKLIAMNEPGTFPYLVGCDEDSIQNAVWEVFTSQEEAWKKWSQWILSQLIHSTPTAINSKSILSTVLMGGIDEKELQATYYSKDWWETCVGRGETKKGYVEWLVYEILIGLADYPREFLLQPFERPKEPLFKKGTKVLSLDGEYADTEDFGQNTFTGENAIGVITDVLPDQENCYSVAFPKGVSVFMSDQELLDKGSYVILT